MIAGDQVDGPIGSKRDDEFLGLQVLELQRIVGVFGIPGPLLWSHEQRELKRREVPWSWMMGYDA